MSVLGQTAVGQGSGLLLDALPAWPDNPTHHALLLVQWQASPDQFYLVVVNFAAQQSQCYAPVKPTELPDHTWTMRDLLSDQMYVRGGAELQRCGLYLDVPPHATECFEFTPT